MSVHFQTELATAWDLEGVAVSGLWKTLPMGDVRPLTLEGVDLVFLDVDEVAALVSFLVLDFSGDNQVFVAESPFPSHPLQVVAGVVVHLVGLPDLLAIPTQLSGLVAHLLLCDRSSIGADGG